MGKIRVLDKTVSNMIAAGEVVERPASVVKELLENSMDAGAKHITVEIKSGGITYIRVADDGVGMSREDAETCLLRHATSKITTADDLGAIKTLGFRGEALASIAAVSNLDIYTKSADDETGTHLSSVCGEITDIGEAGCPLGTTIIVRDLFCSTPARMKFLKKDFTEAGYIKDMLDRLALSHPDISFKLINNGKEALFTDGQGGLSACVYSVYGKDVATAMMPADFNESPVKVHGLVGRGSISRPNRNMQNFFINGRYIKSPLLARATEDAYKNEVMVGKFPVCVLSVELDPSLVDINVHPTKLEAKFADEKHIYHCVYWAVKNALCQGVEIPKVTADIKKTSFTMPTKEETAEPIHMSEVIAPKKEETKKEVSKVTEAKPIHINAALKNENKWTRPETTVREPAIEWPIPEFVPPAAAAKAAPYSVLEEKAEDKAPAESVVIFDETEEVKEQETKWETGEKEAKKEIEYKICGQVFDTYILVEKDGELLMVDQHAAHERLRYEELLRQYRERKIAAQSLIIPAVVTLSAQEMALYREYSEKIATLGFDVEEFGANAVAVRATPEELSERDINELFAEILTMLSQNRKNLDEDLVSRMLYSIACKGAIKANHGLHQSEMKVLLDAVFSLEGINTCPHGRPITIAFTKTFIEKQFKRIV